MSRPKRIKCLDREMCYHLMSKTAGEYFLLSPSFVKEKFLEIMNKLLMGFCFKLEAYVVMDNHFHLLIRTRNVYEIGGEEILRRGKAAGIYRELILKKDVEKLRERLGDISEFMKMLKEKFSKWYNRNFERKGYFWGGRFKSVLIEDGRAFKYCKDYIEMNPVRAGMVENPWEYEYSSCYDKDMEIREEEFLLLEGIDSGVEEGVIFGSFEFVKRIHEEFKEKFNLKNSNKYKVSKNNEFFSYINLRDREIDEMGIKKRKKIKKRFKKNKNNIFDFKSDQT